MKTTLAFLLILLAPLTPVVAGGSAERTQLLDTIFAHLEQHVANPAWLEDESYARLKDRVYSDKALRMSDDAFLSYFNQQAEDLPFTHFYLRKNKAPKKDADTAEKKSPPEPLMWKELNARTAYLKIETFSSDASAMTRAIAEIGTDTYENLIIDLRGNQGGSLDAPVVLGGFLTNDPIDVGVFMTRKWYEHKAHQPAPEEVAQLPYLTDFTYAGIGKMFDEEAAFRLVIPGHDKPVFTGNVYVLQDGNTASANEPLLDVFKQEGMATLVGSHSSGAMLSAYFFPVNDDYRVFIPTADYQTAYGRRIDKQGVAPDVETDPAQALDHVLQVLIHSNYREISDSVSGG